MDPNAEIIDTTDSAHELVAEVSGILCLSGPRFGPVDVRAAGLWRGEVHAMPPSLSTRVCSCA
jgi:hypothetical protein